MRRGFVEKNEEVCGKRSGGDRKMKSVDIENGKKCECKPDQLFLFCSTSRERGPWVHNLQCPSEVKMEGKNWLKFVSSPSVVMYGHCAASYLVF